MNPGRRMIHVGWAYRKAGIERWYASTEPGMTDIVLPELWAEIYDDQETGILESTKLYVQKGRTVKRRRRDEAF